MPEGRADMDVSGELCCGETDAVLCMFFNGPAPAALKEDTVTILGGTVVGRISPVCADISADGRGDTDSESAGTVSLADASREGREN